MVTSAQTGNVAWSELNASTGKIFTIAGTYNNNNSSGSAVGGGVIPNARINTARQIGFDVTTFQNGTQQNTGTHGATNPITVSSIGGQTFGGHDVVGDIQEFIAFSSDNTEVERQQIESYLALKYGITLDQSLATSDDGTGDYILSDGTKVYDAHDGTNQNSYNADISGIGRDDDSALHQRVSKSINSDALVAFSIENDFVNSNIDAGRSDVATDLSFMVWANDNGSTTSWTTAGAPANRSILPRIWKIDETGTMGTVHISVPDNSSALATKLPAENTTIYLLTDTDTIFSNATETELTLNGTNWELPAGIDLADATFFTFATQVSNLAANSIVTATSPIEANGTAISTITVQLVDANGTYLTTSSGTITLATTGDAILSAVVDNGDGTYTATATNTTAETVTILSLIHI